MNERRTYTCSYCNEIIESAIVRFDEGKLFHLDCFERFINPNIEKAESWPCPRCKTAGKIWSKTTNRWKKCKLCHGHGVISEDMIK